MNIQEYISSGTLEAYFLGALPEAERLQVAHDLDMYPELKKEAAEIERAMIGYCQALAVEPAAGTYTRLLAAIAPVDEERTVNEKSNTAEKTRQLAPWWKDYRYAATLVVLIGSVVLNILLARETLQEKQGRQLLSSRMEQIKTDEEALTEELNNYKNSRAMMADTGIQTVIMHTMVTGHPMAATLYWSKATGAAYVAMDALPMPPKGMQYQLWVIQNGKPVSMGMLQNEMVNSPMMQKVAMVVTRGDAFAISLEKRGGNPSPTTVYVLGKA